MRFGLGIVFGCLLSINTYALSYQSTISITNRSGMSLAIITLDKPFNRSDVAYESSLITLVPGQTKIVAPRGSILGWFKRGYQVGFTVLMPNDRHITLVENQGEIKTIHGELRDMPLRNEKYSAITVTTKNPHAGDIDCVPCAQKCFHREHTLDYCECLNYCWDKTRDLGWYFAARTHKNLLVGAGTKLSLSDVVGKKITYTIYR